MASTCDSSFVLTSTNVHRVEQLGGSHQRGYEIIGRPFDITRIVGAVRAARARSVKERLGSE
jgi:hypothetical protein